MSTERLFPFSIKWGPYGHKIIGEAADKLLTVYAREKVKEILSPIKTENLRDIATWADIIKGSIPDDPDSRKFIEKFPDRGTTWHYVDLPLGVAYYDREKYRYFTRDDDIVQTINKCVRVLKNEDDWISCLNALRWLTHLVGDIHQPIHVGCGYVDETGAIPKLITDPDIIEKNNLKDDHGGGYLFFLNDDGKQKNLHSFWDGLLGFHDAEDTENFDPVAIQQQTEIVNEIVKAVLKLDIRNNLSGKSVNEWASEWATESLLKAREAYKTLSIERKINDSKYMIAWEGPEKYNNYGIYGI